MYLIFKTNRTFKLYKNEGYRQILSRSHNLEMYISGNIYDKSYYSVADTDFLLSVNNNILNISNYNGRFSGVIINLENNTLTIFCDRTAGHCIYYSLLDKKIFISDKIFTLASLGCTLYENTAAISTRLLYGYCLGKETYFKNVYTLRCGKVAQFLSDYTMQEIDCDPIYRKDKITKLSPDEFAKQLIYNLRSATNNILSNIQEPVYFTITGGLDSRLLLGLIENINKVQAFCVNNDSNISDVEIAKTLSATINLRTNFYNLDSTYYNEYLDECLLRSEYNCIMHIWFRPYISIPELNKSHILMGLGGGELLRFNNGLPKTSHLPTLSNDEVKEYLLNDKLSISQYLKADYYSEIEQMARNNISDHIMDYLSSRRGIWDYYLDVNFFDAVDMIYHMYPNLNGLSPFLDSNVLDLVCSIPTSAEYSGDNLYNLLYKYIPKEFTELISARNNNIPKEYTQPRHMYSKDTIEKIYDTILQSDLDIFDKDNIHKIYLEKLNKKNYSFSQGEAWLYSYVKMKEYIVQNKYNQKKNENLFSKLFNK